MTCLCRNKGETFCISCSAPNLPQKLFQSLSKPVPWGWKNNLTSATTSMDSDTETIGHCNPTLKIHFLTEEKSILVYFMKKAETTHCANLASDYVYFNKSVFLKIGIVFLRSYRCLFSSMRHICTTVETAFNFYSAASFCGLKNANVVTNPLLCQI